MMDSKTVAPEDVMSDSDNPAAVLKQKCLNNGADNQKHKEISEANGQDMLISENGTTCNGSTGVEESLHIDSTESHVAHGTKQTAAKKNEDKDTKDDNIDDESVNGPHYSRDDDVKAVSSQKENSSNHTDETFPSSVDTGHNLPKEGSSETVDENKFQNGDVNTGKEGDDSLDCDKETVKEKHDANAGDSSSKALEEDDERGSPLVEDEDRGKHRTENKDVPCICDKSDRSEEAPKTEEKMDASDDNNSGKNAEMDSDRVNKDKEATDSEKENVDKNASKKDNKDETTVSSSAEEVSPDKSQNKEPSQTDSTGGKREKRSERSDSATDDIEIIGESKVIHIGTPHNTAQASQNVVFVPAGLPHSSSGFSMTSQGFIATSSHLLATSTMQNPVLMQSLTPSIQSMAPGFVAGGMHNFSPGYAFPGGMTGQGTQNVSLLTSVAPPKPKSSLDQIELIRWEIQNRVNTRPKYFKPNPTSDLGPLAKFLFDIGSDLIKESVYHDLVKIQSKKNDDDKLTDKEKEDLEKLKEIEKDLYATIGHLKLRLKKQCKVCHFQTESSNVMYLHKQYPHEDNKILRCAHCSFFTKQVMAFKFHMEAEHNVQPKLHDKKAFYECDLCPYENNQEQKLLLHKQRCIKQFRPLFNLHPSCLSGAEINLCLENIFYKPVIPKNLKLLQQKHAQQQAALAEARRQQAQMQALAAQKNAAAMAAKKQQQLQQQQQQKHQPQPIAPRYNASPGGRMPFPTKMPVPQQSVRYNASANLKGSRPTVANMLNNKQSPILPAGMPQNSTVGGFEVCEICGGYVKDRKALRIHFFYAHRIDLPFNLFERNQAPLYCATCYVRFWTAQGLRKHIDTHKEENQTRGIVGKCISCGHHVLNLLLHMRIVHNREMQHYINALMCMFCGGHFGSRQECERHILKSHGNVDPVTGTLKTGSSQPIQPQPPKSSTSSQKKAGNNSLVKGSVCVLCNLNFGRNVDLTRHCMRMHHTCMKCGMVVIDKASLMKHTCLSSPSGTRDCSMCGETGFHPAYYVKHLRDKHLRKFSIRVAKLSKSTVERWTKRPCPFKEPEEILVEISDSDDDIPLNKLRAPPTKSSPSKKPRIGPACKIGRRPENAENSDKNVAAKMDRVEEAVVKVDDEEDTDIIKKPEGDEKPKDIEKSEGDKKPEDSGKEVIDLDSTRDISSADEDSKSGESPRGRKRKSTSDSPGSERSSKRRKSSS